MEDLTDHVLTQFLASVIRWNPKGSINKDIINLLEEYQLQAQQERVEIDVVRKRALRAFELAYAAVFSVDLLNLNWAPPDPRASLETLDTFVDRLRVRVDDAVVFNVELSFGEQVEQKGPKQMKKMEMQRLHKAGVLLLDKVGILFRVLREPEGRYVAGELGEVLSYVCQNMAIGLSKQAMFAEQLLHV